MLKKLLQSKILRALLSLVLIYFAFRRVDTKEIIDGLRGVPIKWVVFHLLYTITIVILGSYRWSLLVLPKVGFKEVVDFTKASFSGAFANLFFPSSMAGDLVKWLPLRKKYKEINKLVLFSSVFFDRVIGFSAFIFSAFIAACIGKWVTNFQYPDYLLWLFGFLTLGVIIFYIVVFNFNFDFIFDKLKFLEKFRDVVQFIRTKSKSRILSCLLVAFIIEFIWIMQVWIVSNIFGAGFTIISVFIFLPIIALILVLPISIAGFGAREHLFLFFFSQAVVTSDAKILLVSSFMGIIGILNALLGGVSMLF